MRTTLFLLRGESNSPLFGNPGEIHSLLLEQVRTAFTFLKIREGHSRVFGSFEQKKPKHNLGALMDMGTTHQEMLTALEPQLLLMDTVFRDENKVNGMRATDTFF